MSGPPEAFCTCGPHREILKLLTPEQLDRYEAYRRSSLSKRNMKRVPALVRSSCTCGPPALQRLRSCLRRALSATRVRRAQLLQSVANQAPHPNSTIVMCGIAKMFVGELVEAGASPCPCPLCPADP